MGGRHDISQRELRLSVETRPALGKRLQLTTDAELHHISHFFFSSYFFLYFSRINVFIARFPDQGAVKIVILRFD